jgi:putative ABC transport system permease protein
MSTLIRDIRHGVRVLLREPGFTLLAVLALALGIGATTAIFTVTDSVLLRPLPYHDPDRLVVALIGPDASGPVSPADFLDFREGARSFDGLAAAQAWGGTLSGGQGPERLAGLRVSAELFDLLGVPAALGRTFKADDDEPGRDRILVMSHGLWQRRFGGDPSIVGQPVVLDGESHIVVGVMPPSFRFAPFWQTRAEVWAPLALAARRADRGGRSLRLFGRLKDDVSVAQAQAEMSVIARRLEEAHPATNAGVGITVRPLLDKVVAGIRPTLVALSAMVAFVLLIACANVANALLARSSVRRKEIALRLAIGASHWRVVRQLLTESVLLAVLGGMAGLLLAHWGIAWLLAMLPPGSLPRQQEVAFDGRVFALATAATLLAGVVTGLVPAMQLARASLTGVLQSGGRSTTDGVASRRLRGGLIAAEVALAVVLLVGAGLMGRTMLRLGAVEPGFQVEGVAVGSVSVAGTSHVSPAARTVMFLNVRERLSASPGVAAVGAINHLPLAGDLWNLDYTIEGRSRARPGEGLSAVYRIVQPGYFDAIGLPLAAGRDISDADTAATPHVAIINKAMADRHWPGATPIGRRLFLPGPSRVTAPITIVGIAANARQGDWTGAPADEVYLAYAQRSGEFGLTTMTFVLRGAGDAERIAASVPGEIALLDPTVTVSDNMTMEAVVASELWRERLTAMLTGLFAGIALGLAAIGVYAVVVYSVARRTREFGVRLAVGATTRSVVNLAIVDALGPVVLGAGVGLIAALGASRLIRSLLFDASALDPVALVGAVAILCLTAVAAAWIPARRASQVDPLTALRHE